MPLQNRVTPAGEIVATTARGTMYGNRGGCFHRDDGTLLARRFATRQWICCVLEFKGRRRRLRQPGRFTELFFLDEATAMAAGHRPCFECRRAAATQFAELWNDIERRPGRAAAPDMDVRLHAERIDNDGGKRTTAMRGGALADGTFVRHERGPALAWGGRLHLWSFAGYAPLERVPAAATYAVLTPPTMVAILASGYRPTLHPSISAG